MAKIKGGTLTFEVTDDGSLKLLEGKTKKTKKAVDDLSRSEATLNRNFKGASQQSSNASKNFSKMAQGITGGLVPAYATLAANVFAITAAFRFLSDAANFRILTEGAREYATITGESLSLITSRLQEATGQQLAFSEAAQSVAIARAAGVTTDQISRLGELAKNASIALGRDLTDSLNRLIRGVTKAEPELLDELGIILRLEIATEKYAEQMGIAGRKLSIFEKSQAVVNEVLAQGEEKFGQFNTELNAFSQLAKSFDDLLNNIKFSLSGVAEFIAKTLSKNVIALAGAFTLLGTGILRAVMPTTPQFNQADATASLQQDIGKFYKGSEARLKRFQQGSFTGADIKALEKSFSTQKSSVMNFENFRRSEARKTMMILKGFHLQIEADGKNAITRMFAKMRAERMFFAAEYGQFVGTMKFLGSKLASAISLVGYLGILVSAIGLLTQFMEKFKDPAQKEFEERNKRVVKSLEKQNIELQRLNDNLKQTRTFLAAINQESMFFSNFSFKGVADQFGNLDFLTQRRDFVGKDSGQSLRQNIDLFGADMGLLMAQREEQTPTVTRSFTKDQIKILEGVIDSLEIQQGRLTEGKLFDDVQKRIDSIKDALSAEDVDENVLQKLREELIELETVGTDAQQAITKLTTAPQNLNNAAEQFGRALASFRQGATPLTQITESIGLTGETLLGLTNQDMTEALAQFKNLGGQVDKVIDNNTLGFLQTILGKDALSGFVTKRDGKDVIAGTGTAMGDLDIIREIGGLVEAEMRRLREIEIGFMTDKLNLQSQFIAKTEMVGPITTKNIKQQEKLKMLQLEKEQKETTIRELEAKGLEQNAVFIEKANAEMALIDAKIEQAANALDLVKQVNNVAIDAMESNLATALQAIITGAKSAKEAFADMAKSILNSIAQILAQQAAMAIMNFLPFGGAGGRSGGIMSAPGYRSFSMGGVASGPNSGYPAVLHGTEAVVPLPNGRSIPVEMSGGAGVNNINVNVNMTTGQVDSESDNAEMIGIGKAIAEAVKNEIEVQQRPGGSLSLY
jgi:hypothetical protein